MGISQKSMVVAVIVFFMLVVAPLGSTATAAERAAVFPVCYRCGTGLPGAPTLTILGSVSTQISEISATGVVTQAVSPPLNLHATMRGAFIWDGKSVEVHAVGYSREGFVTLVLILPDGWGKPGKASFSWYTKGHHGDSGGNVPAAPCK